MNSTTIEPQVGQPIPPGSSSKKLKLLFAFGTRPEAIKMAPLIKEALICPLFKVIIVATAQHRKMLDQVLEAFSIHPHYDFNLMSPNQNLNQLISHTLNNFDQILEKEKPDWVFVHGDTSTTLACAMAAFHRNISVAHVEAGLRTYNTQSPFPEEMNRQIVSKIANLHLTPTLNAQKNLLRERIPESKILLVGNTVIDTLHLALDEIQESPRLIKRFEKSFPYLNQDKKVILVTVHRRENFGQGIKNICMSISQMIQIRNDIQFVIPVHPNPNVKGAIEDHLSKLENVHLIDPQDYLAFTFLMLKSYLILSDSGGIQEEAPALGKPVLVLRETTERPEALQSHCALLIGNSKDNIVKALIELLDDRELYESMSKVKNPFGDGSASKKIISYFKSLTDNTQINI
ncbi:MAG: UDP-N-acetylglucosamine 2-epimerase (non-hydrolyzing) [Bdellovibrionaceae bacterium]|nr:UDP-N-acetylglucosamine 2-epimerase (non-hydrolyzing) [Pseudobdellovibrionaceae bacterium]